MTTPNPELRIVYDDGCRPQTPHAPADWQLTREGVRQHLARITSRRHLRNSVRCHGQHQGEEYLALAAERFVDIDFAEASRVVDEPLRLCPVSARKTVDGWAREGEAKRRAEYAAMRSGVAA